MAEAAITKAEAAVKAVEDSDPRRFFNESEAVIAIKVVFRDTAAAAKLVSGAYKPMDEKGTYGSTLFAGRAATMTVDGNTVFRPVLDTETPSDITGTADAANVTVRIRDERGTALTGFVEFTVDTSAAGAEDAVFVGSSRTTQYVKLSGGAATVQVTDLAKAILSGFQ